MRIKRPYLKFFIFIRKLRKQVMRRIGLNYKKHKILTKLVSKSEQGEENSGLGVIITDLGKSCTNIEIHKATNINIILVDSICFSLIDQGYIKHLQNDEKNKSHRYLITDAGRVAIYENNYLKLVWYRNWEIWKWLTPTLISITSLVVAILAYLLKTKVVH